MESRGDSMKHLKNILLLCVLIISLTGCNTNKANAKEINSDLYDEGSQIAIQLYEIKDDINSNKDFDLDNYEEFMSQKEETFNEDEKQFLSLIEDLFVKHVVYLADYQEDNKIESESIKELDRVAEKLQKEYGVPLD